MMMENDNVAIAEAYYKAWEDKNVEKMGGYLQPDVLLISPLNILKGKEQVLEVLKKGGPQNITIRAKFSSGNQVMLAFDMTFSDFAENLRCAVLMTFKDGLIAHSELFFDPRIFFQKS